MTGTVLDGNIDVAILKTDGETVQKVGENALIPYDKGIINLLGEVMQVAQQWQFNGPHPEIFSTAEKALTRAQAQAVVSVLENAGIAIDQIGVVGFHGQTVLHRAPTEKSLGQTCQLGDGKLMASLLGTKVAYDFRSADVAAGGQGAPLAAIYHGALINDIDPSGDTAVLNIGGVSNITWWDGAHNLIAFDTGPGNGPINDLVRLGGLGNMDVDGKLAATGVVNEQRLDALLEHHYFRLPYPKSLDRFDFTTELAHGLSIQDGAALLTAFIAAAVGLALDRLPIRPRRIIVCGGGRRNPSIMRELTTRANIEVVPAEAVGWQGDATEAECFAFLGVRVLRGLPTSFPSTTGVPAALSGGRLAEPM